MSTVEGIRASMNDGIAFDAFFRVEHRRLVALATILCGDRETGCDIAQEALIRTYANWDKVANLDRPAAWTRRVVVNLTRDYGRHRAVLRRRLPEVARQQDFSGAITDRPHDSEFWDAAVRPGRGVTDRRRRLQRPDRTVPNINAGALIAYGPGDIAYLTRQGASIQDFAVIVVPLSGDSAGTAVATQPANINLFLEYPPLSFGHGPGEVIHRREYVAETAVAPYVGTDGQPITLDTAPAVFVFDDDLERGLGGVITSTSGMSWTLAVEVASDRADTYVGVSPPAPGRRTAARYRQTGVQSGNLSEVDAADRARARRVARARAVVILAALAGAALLLLIVVGSLTSDTTDEMGHPNRGHIGLTVR